MYLGQSLAVISDNTMIPDHLVTPSVALFMLIVTIIGGNSPLLVPGIAASLTNNDVTITFDAQQVYVNSTSG
jgi:hypothetical protein